MNRPLDGEGYDSDMNGRQRALSGVFTGCLWLLSAAFQFAGCAVTTDQGPWGGAAHWPGAGELKQAAMEAARDPQTWVPIVAAAGLSVTGADESLSEWAARERPVFGSNAADASDRLRTISKWSYVATALIAPSDSLGQKAKGLAVGVGAIVATNQATYALKSLTGRERPDGSDDESFPSGHTSVAAAAATLSARNVAYMPMPGNARRALQIGFYSIAGLTGWARVEAEKHHVSDSLAGYALGHFIASFAHGAFLQAGVDNVDVSYDAEPDGGALTFRIALGGNPARD